jgi:dihydroorotase-like cyclic amidohydrolase
MADVLITSPDYLLLDSEEYNRAGFEAAKYLMTPPLRDYQCQSALWRALKFDDLQTVGSDADFMLFDPNQDQVISATAHHSNVDYSLYEGCCFTGKVEVFLSGDLIVDGDQWLDRKGSGKYQKRSASSVF